MNANRLVIIHYAPVELYPPAQNLFNALLREEDGVRLAVLTTRAPFFKLNKFSLVDEKSAIIRVGISDARLNPLVRYCNYLYFNIYCLFYLLLKWPKKLMYFETLSAWPVYIFKRYFRKDADIFIHYHEYMSIDDYSRGMFLNRYFHSLEKKIYKSANWVSHTNDFRMDMFKKDLSPVVVFNSYILPNYPPKSWSVTPKTSTGVPIKMVFVGAISMQTMYVAEFANWVNTQNGRVQWDIFSHNYSRDVLQFFNELKSNWITLNDAVRYADLPQKLRSFDIGIILYKGSIKNHIYSAPNKLFEYVAFGLDILFPIELIGSLPYIRKSGYPKILGLDFRELDTIDLEFIKRKPTDNLNKFLFYCEDALAPLLAELEK